MRESLLEVLYRDSESRDSLEPESVELFRDTFIRTNDDETMSLFNGVVRDSHKDGYRRGMRDALRLTSEPDN